MKIYGNIITARTINQIMTQILALDKPFTFSEVQRMADRLGVPHMMRDRLVNRLLQGARREGVIRFAAGQWHVIHDINKGTPQ